MRVCFKIADITNERKLKQENKIELKLLSKLAVGVNHL